MRDGVKPFKADTGQDTWEVGPSQADAAAQVQIVETLIARGVDAICIAPFSVEAVEPVLEKAREPGVVVISHEASNIQNVDDDIEAFDNLAYGAKPMEVLGKPMGGKGKDVATVGSLTSKSQNARIDGAIAYRKAHFPDMSLATNRFETYDDANQDDNKLKEARTTCPDVIGILGAPMPTSVAGQYRKDDDSSDIQFWDPAAAGYAMNELPVMVLNKKKVDLKASMDLGLPGYDSIQTRIRPSPICSMALAGSA